MADTVTSWMIGGFTLAANATVTIGGTDRTIPAGDWYLRDATSSISLIDKLQTEIAAVVAGSTVVIRKDRKVHIDFNGTPTTLVIPSSLAEYLGFTSSPYGSAATRTAENVSTLLWSPGWPETPDNSPAGVAGRKVYDRVMTSSPTGQTFNVTLHHSMTMADWSWRFVRPERAWTTSENPGEYVVFFENVIVPGARMKLYPQMSEDDASTSAVSWTTALGPYVVPTPDFDWYQRAVAATDAIGANIEIAAMKTSEYS